MNATVKLNKTLTLKQWIRIMTGMKNVIYSGRLRLLVFFFSLFFSGCVSQQSTRQPTKAARIKETQSQNLWPEMSQRFTLSEKLTTNPDVLKQIHWYQEHKAYLYKVAIKSRPYLYYIYKQTQEHKLPPELALLPIIESAYNPFAYSSRGAAGLWQFMPVTASVFNLRENWWYDGRRDLVDSTDAALTYLAYLDKFFNHNWILAIAAYDSGEGTIQHSMRYNKKHHLSTDFWDLHLPQETQNYVPKLLALAIIISNPSTYHIKLPPIPNHPLIAVVPLQSQIDLAHAAKLAHISLKELYTLNPGFNHWATAPKGPYRLVLPADKASKFKEGLAKLPKSKRVSWRRYSIKPGDSLYKIAHHYGISIKIIKEINKLHANRIKIGQILLIPASSSAAHQYLIASQKHRVDTAQFIPKTRHIYHTVKPGESIWSIAHHYQVKETQIYHWNHLKRTAFLHPGQKLSLWTHKTRA